MPERCLFSFLRFHITLERALALVLIMSLDGALQCQECGPVDVGWLYLYDFWVMQTSRIDCNETFSPTKIISPLLMTFETDAENLVTC